MATVSERLVKLRAGLNISQMRLSKALGVSQAAINRYEHSQSSVPHGVIIKYADFFDVSADYILGRTDKPEGKHYNNEPEAFRLSVIREGEWTDFIEACFDPRSPMNKKLKEMMLSMTGESIVD
jgi:transcriptional regulator with XRE-family HTH domain